MSGCLRQVHSVQASCLGQACVAVVDRRATGGALAAPPALSPGVATPAALETERRLLRLGTYVWLREWRSRQWILARRPRRRKRSRGLADTRVTRARAQRPGRMHPSRPAQLVPSQLVSTRPDPLLRRHRSMLAGVMSALCLKQLPLLSMLDSLISSRQARRSASVASAVPRRSPQLQRPTLLLCPRCEHGLSALMPPQTCLHAPVSAWHKL
jgi:hypothetical protein